MATTAAKKSRDGRGLYAWGGPPGPDEVLTTGRCSELLRVAPRTASKWIDRGHLKGYQLPASKDRRVHAADLAEFMLANRMFRAIGSATVALGGHLYEARLHDRWGSAVARVAPPGSDFGAGVDWRPGGEARYELKAASDEIHLVLADAGFRFIDGR